VVHELHLFAGNENRAMGSQVMVPTTTLRR
jgi:hypothetical protein